MKHFYDAKAILRLAFGLGLALAAAVRASPPDEQTCRSNFRREFGRLDFDRDIRENNALLGCVTSAGGRCCSEIKALLGSGTSIAGCTCYEHLYGEAFAEVSRNARASGVSSSIMNVARDVVERRIGDCGLPAPGSSFCRGAEEEEEEELSWRERFDQQTAGGDDADAEEEPEAEDSDSSAAAEAEPVADDADACLSLRALVEAEGDLSVFAQAVDRLGQAGWLDGPYDAYRQSGGEYSFFVPTDDAFASLLRAYDVTQDALFADEGALAAWVKAHVVREARADPDGTEELYTYSGETLAFNGTVLQGKCNEASVMPPLNNNNRTVSACGGSAFVIDSVILPDFSCPSESTNIRTNMVDSERLMPDPVRAVQLSLGELLDALEVSMPVDELLG